MWTYQQSTGKLFDCSGALVGTGYSGHGEGVNNPDTQNVKYVGPLPCGLWIFGQAFDDEKKGKCVLRIYPKMGTETFGRDGFMMHGDLKSAPGKRLASEGCLIFDYATRNKVAESVDHFLRVIR